MFRYTKKIIDIFVKLAIVGFFVMALYNFAARVDGFFRPIVTDFAVFDISPHEDLGTNYSVLSGAFQKPRGECVYEGIIWYYGKPNRFGLAADATNVRLKRTYFEDKPLIRGEGLHSYDRLIVNLTEEQIKESFGFSVHKCNFMNMIYWYTNTPLGTVAEMLGNGELNKYDEQREYYFNEVKEK